MKTQVKKPTTKSTSTTAAPRHRRDNSPGQHAAGA
jgi:hypothetical protein